MREVRGRKELEKKRWEGYEKITDKHTAGRRERREEWKRRGKRNRNGERKW